MEGRREKKREVTCLSEGHRHDQRQSLNPLCHGGKGMSTVIRGGDGGRAAPCSRCRAPGLYPLLSIVMDSAWVGE